MAHQKIVGIPSKRQNKAQDFWLKVAKDLAAGDTPEEVSKKYINPKTGRHYRREHIYWIIRKLKQNIIIVSDDRG